jgi:aspartate 1-decarboxylase
MVIIMAFTWLADADAANFSQKIVRVTAENKPVE